MHNYSERMDAANKDHKVKTIIDFIDQDTASVKGLGVKTKDSKNNNAIYQSKDAHVFKSFLESFRL